MVIRGFAGKQEIELTDVCIFLTKEQAEEILWNLESFKEQEEFAPLKENEAIIMGETINDVIVKNSIELHHMK